MFIVLNQKTWINFILKTFLNRYTRQVLNESLRCNVVAPYAARFQDVHTELGGFHIPANVSLMHLKYNKTHFAFVHD